MATRYPPDFYGALRACAEEIWRMPNQAALLRQVPERTLHADLFWGSHTARLLLSPSGDAAVVSTQDPKDFLACKRPPAVAAGQTVNVRHLDLWHASRGHRKAYAEAAALADQAARDAWGAAFVAGPLNAAIADPEQRFLPPGQAPERPTLTCKDGDPAAFEALLADVLAGIGGEGDLFLSVCLDPETEEPVRLDGIPKPTAAAIQAVRTAVAHLVRRFRPGGRQLHYNDGPILLQGGYHDGPPTIHLEQTADATPSAHARQAARARLAAAGVPL